MAAPAESSPSGTSTDEPSRRTWLAVERTWLAWWRTGLATAALAIAVGRLLPGLTRAPRLPFRLLGLGYGVLAVCVLIVGAVRQQSATKALRRGDYAELSSSLVLWLTAAAVALATGTLVLVAMAL